MLSRCALGVHSGGSRVVSGLERAAQHQVGKQGPLQMRVLLLDGAHPLRLFIAAAVKRRRTQYPRRRASAPPVRSLKCEQRLSTPQPRRRASAPPRPPSTRSRAAPPPPQRTRQSGRTARARRRCPRAAACRRSARRRRRAAAAAAPTVRGGRTTLSSRRRGRRSSASGRRSRRLGTGSECKPTGPASTTPTLRAKMPKATETTTETKTETTTTSAAAEVLFSSAGGTRGSGRAPRGIARAKPDVRGRGVRRRSG